MFEYYILLNIEYYYHEIQEKIAKRDAKAILRLMIGVCVSAAMLFPQNLYLIHLYSTASGQGISWHW